MVKKMSMSIVEWPRPACKPGMFMSSARSSLCVPWAFVCMHACRFHELRPSWSETCVPVYRGLHPLHSSLWFIPLGSHSNPAISCVDISEDINGEVNVTVSWTMCDGKSTDFYLINITTNASQIPYEGLLNISTSSVTQYELTGFMTGYEYNITVVCAIVKHGGMEWSESEPLTIKPQGRLKYAFILQQIKKKNCSSLAYV